MHCLKSSRTARHKPGDLYIEHTAPKTPRYVKSEHTVQLFVTNLYSFSKGKISGFLVFGICGTHHPLLFRMNFAFLDHWCISHWSMKINYMAIKTFIRSFYRPKICTAGSKIKKQIEIIILQRHIQHFMNKLGPLWEIWNAQILKNEIETNIGSSSDTLKDTKLSFQMDTISVLIPLSSHTSCTELHWSMWM